MSIKLVIVVIKFIAQILCYSRREWNSYYNEFRFLKRRMSSSQSNDGDQSEDQPDGTTDPEMGIDTPAPKMQRLV